MSEKLVIRINNAKPVDSASKRPQQITVYHWNRIIGAAIVLIAVTGLAAFGLYRWVTAEHIDPDTIMSETLTQSSTEKSAEVTKAPDLQAAPESVENTVETQPGNPAALENPIAESTEPLATGQKLATSESAELSANSQREKPSEPVSTALARTDSQENGVPKEQPTAIAAPAPANTEVEDGAEPFREDSASAKTPVSITRESDHLTRLVLTREVINDEPTGSVAETISMGSERLIKVMVFTEMQGLKGREIFHTWYLGGEKMAQIRVRPHLDVMTASSSKYIDLTMKGDWRVLIEDSRGVRLADIRFDVI